MNRLSKLSRLISGGIALTTGTASGMGGAATLLFADEGAAVAMTDFEPAAIDIVVQKIR